MSRNFKRLSIGVGVALALSPVALAQWSIGKPGTRQAPQGQNRYAVPANNSVPLAKIDLACFRG
jgi:hypothetical protein